MPNVTTIMTRVSDMRRHKSDIIDETAVAKLMFFDASILTQMLLNTGRLCTYI